MLAFAVLSLSVFGQILGFLVGQCFDHVFKHVAQHRGISICLECYLDLGGFLLDILSDVHRNFFQCFHVNRDEFKSSDEHTPTHDMTRKGTTGFRVDLFVPIMAFTPQILLQLVTGGEDPGPVEAGVIGGGFLCLGSLFSSFCQ